MFGKPVSFLGSVEAAELSSPSRITPAMADESWKAHTHCWLCNRRAYKEADKRRLPAAASEPHDLTVLTPDSEWVHESCSSLIRKSRRVRTSAPAAQAPLISQCWAPSSAPPPPPPPRVSFRPSSSGAAGQLEPLSQGAYWDPPGSRRGEAVSPAGPDCHPLGRGTRAASASSGTASSSKNMEDTPAGPRTEVSDDLGRGNRAASANSGTASSSTTMEGTPLLFAQAHLLGGLRTGLAAAEVREQTGRAARPPPASPATRVAVGSVIPWSSLDAPEARVRGKAESQARQKSFKQAERLDAHLTTARLAAVRTGVEMRLLQRELAAIDKPAGLAKVCWIAMALALALVLALVLTPSPSPSPDPNPPAGTGQEQESGLCRGGRGGPRDPGEERHVSVRCRPLRTLQ